MNFTTPQSRTEVACTVPSNEAKTASLSPRKFYVWTLLALLAWTGQPLLAQSRKGSVVVLNLRTYGWEPSGQHEHDNPSIAVDNEGRVLIGFTVRARSGLVTRNHPSLDFRVLRFTADGKVDVSLSLPTHVKGINGIYLSDTGQIIARANDSLQFLQADDGNPQNGVWKTLCAESCSILQSPTRHTLVLHIWDAESPLTILRFSPQPVQQQCAQAPQFIDSDDGKIRIYPRSITDEFAYFFRPDGPAYRWPFCDYNHDRVKLPLHGPYRVLNDKFFVMHTSSSRTGNTDRHPEVTSLDGQIKFRPATLKYESVVGDDLKTIRSDARGDRIAVLLVTRRGGNLRLDLSSHVTALRVAVYDIEAEKEIASIPVNLKEHSRFEFDLSPDGHHLATLEDDTVRVVNLDEERKP